MAVMLIIAVVIAFAFCADVNVFSVELKPFAQETIGSLRKKAISRKIN